MVLGAHDQATFPGSPIASKLRQSTRCQLGQRGSTELGRRRAGVPAVEDP